MDKNKIIIRALIQILKLVKPEPLGLSHEWFDTRRKETDEIIEMLENTLKERKNGKIQKNPNRSCKNRRLDNRRITRTY